MPCYTQNTASIEFGKNTNVGMFKEAAKVLGEHLYSESATRLDYFSFRLDNGQLVYDPVRFTPDKLAQLKRAYSEQILIATAKRNGWQVSWTTNKSGNRQAEVIRASR